MGCCCTQSREGGRLQSAPNRSHAVYRSPSACGRRPQLASATAEHRVRLIRGRGSHSNPAEAVPSAPVIRLVALRDSAKANAQPRICCPVTVIRPFISARVGVCPLIAGCFNIASLTLLGLIAGKRDGVVADRLPFRAFLDRLRAFEKILV